MKPLARVTPAPGILYAMGAAVLFGASIIREARAAVA